MYDLEDPGAGQAALGCKGYNKGGGEEEGTRVQLPVGRVGDGHLLLTNAHWAV